MVSRLLALNNLDSASLGTAIINTGSTKESSSAISEQLNLLFNVHEYKELKLQIEPFATSTSSVDTAGVHKVVQLLAGAESPIGLMVLNGTKIPGADWQAVAAAQAKTGWLSCLTAYIFGGGQRWRAPPRMDQSDCRCGARASLIGRLFSRRRESTAHHSYLQASAVRDACKARRHARG